MSMLSIMRFVALYLIWCKFSRIDYLQYFGYGILANNTEPTEEGVYECALTAYHYITDTLEISPKHIIIYGTSMGTGKYWMTEMLESDMKRYFIGYVK